jgi:hypothetical protein
MKPDAGTARPSRKPELLAAVGLVLLYLAVFSGHSYSIDGVLIYRQALAIVADHSLRFPTPIYWYDIFTTSKYGIGLSLTYLPGVLVAWLLGLPVPATSATALSSDMFYRDPVYALGAAPVHVVVTAATAYLIARLVRELGHGTKPALFALLAYGVASPAIVYARGDFPQPLLGLCLVAGFLAAVRYRRTGSAQALVIAAASICLAVLTRPVEGSLLLPALLVLIAPGWRMSQWRPAIYPAGVALAGAYVLAVGLTLAVNWGRFGTPFQTGYSQISWGTPIWIGLPGVLVSPARGILWQFPLIVLFPLGLWRLWHSEHRAVAVAAGALVAALLLNTALWIPWWGAFSWGSRLFVPALPIAAALVPSGATAISARVRAPLLGVLFVLGVVWAVPGSVTNLLGGYGGTYDGTGPSFALSGYPPIGAWAFLHHLRPLGAGDSSGIDIVWFRLARLTDNVSLVIPVVLLAGAALFVWLAYRQSRGSESDIRGGRPAPVPSTS